MDKNLERIIAFIEQKKRQIEGQYILHAMMNSKGEKLNLDFPDRAKLCEQIETMTARAKTLGIMHGQAEMLLMLTDLMEEIIDKEEE
jgi:hypothetical protein